MIFKFARYVNFGYSSFEIYANFETISKIKLQEALKLISVSVRLNDGTFDYNKKINFTLNSDQTLSHCPIRTIIFVIIINL